MYSLIIILLLLNFDSYFELELYNIIGLNLIVFFEDYYNSLNNFLLNDFIALKLSFFFFNGIEFLIFGLLLLYCSIVCINLFKNNKKYSTIKQNNLLNVFDFFKNFIDFSFLKKQNLNKQTNLIPSLRFFKKQY